MEWQKFGQLLIALREEPLVTRKGRVQAGGLSRQELCSRIFRLFEERNWRVGGRAIRYTEHEIYNTLVDLELGRISHLNERRQHILLAITEVLPLTRMERVELLALANGIPQKDVLSGGVSREQAFDRFKQLLAQVQLPAFVTDSLGNLILANTSAIELYGGERLLQLYWDMMARLQGSTPEEALTCLPRIPNVLYFVIARETGFYDMFLAETKEQQRWREDILVSNVQFYRRTSLPFRATLRWKRLWKWFTQDVPSQETRQRFLEYWQKAWRRKDLDGNAHRVYMMRFCTGNGEDRVTLRYLAVVSRELVRGDVLYMTTYAPLDTTTAEVFSLLASRAGQRVLDMRMVVDFLFPLSEMDTNTL